MRYFVIVFISLKCYCISSGLPTVDHNISTAKIIKTIYNKIIIRKFKIIYSERGFGLTRRVATLARDSIMSNNCTGCTANTL